MPELKVLFEPVSIVNKLPALMVAEVRYKAFPEVSAGALK